ncbi:hypothetical protein GQ600_18470 [Phytophthora cactorum]|nr:hypothetical protein GQ600_18470 [Phytophthora cactorum]
MNIEFQDSDKRLDDESGATLVKRGRSTSLSVLAGWRPTTMETNWGREESAGSGFKLEMLGTVR